MTFIFDATNLSKCLCLATAATVFYKKSFQRDWIKTIILLLMSACAADLNTTLFLTFLTVTGINVYYNWTWIKTCSLSTCVFFFLAILDIMQIFFEDRLPYTVVITFVAAIPQFMRCQLFKTRLREVRAKLGPVYILYGFKSAFLILEVNSSVGYLIFASAILSSLAGFIFRPDNGVMLSFFKAGVRSDVRKRIHRCLMIASLTWYAIAVLWFSGHI